MVNSNASRTILITGCSSGIGAYCARALKKDGWDVFATARKPEDCAELKAEGLRGLYLDYTEPGSIADCVAAVLAKTDGQLDALFNNGAYGQPGAVEDLSVETLKAQFETNFFGWHDLTCRVVPVMRKQGHGRIVHCSSVLGWVPRRYRGAYNSSKFALEGLASTMRLELVGSGIHVMLIEPGPIVSKFTANGIEPFKRNINFENSAHKRAYERQLKRLESGGGKNRFRQGPDAVYKKLNHALNARFPRAHYGVTFPTHAMDFARRFVPQRILDRLLLTDD